MRKFLLVLLTMGLIMAFAMPAAALDVKFGGSYYVQGIYDHNRSLTGGAGDGSTQFIAQRLRMQTEFKIAEGLSLVTRFDALEKKWGDNTWGGHPNYDSVNRVSSGNGVSREQENIEFERAYIDFNTAIGRFMVGYQNFIAFGTSFIDTHVARPGIKYILPIGNTTIVLAMEQIKEGESNLTVTTVSPATSGNHVSNTAQGYVSNGDKTAYDFAVIQKFKGGDAGVLFQYLYGKDTNNMSRSWYGSTPPPSATAIAGQNNGTTKAFIIDPYVKATFGPVFMEAELYYGGGYLYEYENRSTAPGPDVKIETWGAYVHAMANLAPAYVGAKFIWMKGDDPKSAGEREGGLAAGLSMGQIASPCMILFNDETSTWMGNIGRDPFVNNFIDNVWLYGIYAGVKPIPKLDIQVGVYYAYADEEPTANGLTASATNPRYVDRVYGTEVDIIAKYKIYDNLEYMLGFGYLFAGDYFKGTNNSKNVNDDYMVTHKLTLSF